MMTIANKMTIKGVLIALCITFPQLITAQISVPATGCSPVENFDNSNPWTFGGVNPSWTWANPNKLDVSDDISIGGKALVLGGNTTTSTYNQSEDSWAESPEYDLTNANNPYLSFNFYWSNEGSTSFDEIWMEYSLNNGATWADLAAPIGTGACYDQNWYNYQDNWGGNNGGCFPGLGGPSGWVLVRKCINSLGNQSSVKFRFRISTGTTCQNFGATVDQFKVCDAGVVAEASYQCTQQPLEIEFTDESYDCPTSWYWDFGDGNISVTDSPTHAYNSAGIYTVTLTVTTSTAATSGCGGPFQDIYTFDVEVLEASVNSQSNVTCVGLSNGSVSMLANGATAGASFNWTPVPAIGQGTINASGLLAGNYVFTITGANTSCVAETIVTITEPNPIQVSYGSANVSCFNLCDGTLTAVITGGQPPYTSVWSPGNLNGSIQSGVCPGDYDIDIQDGNGCQFTELAVASVLSEPEPTIHNNLDTNVCIGSSLNLNDFETSNGVTQVGWSVVSGTDIGFGLSGLGNIPDFTPQTQGQVQVEVIPQINATCVGAPIVFTIDVFPSPSPDFKADYMGNCEPLLASFNVLNPDLNSSYEWQLGTSSIIGTGHFISAEFQSGSHSIHLKEISVNGCVGEITKLDLFSVAAKPDANFTFTPNYYFGEQTEVHFINQSTNATSYSWEVEGTNLASIDEDVVFQLIDDGKGFYKIQLVAISDSQCSDSIQRIIKVQEPEIIYAPNAFSPFNGSINQTFKPIIQSGINIYKYKLVVYDRWGEIVFVSYNPDYGWDGLLKDGSKALVGVYVYKIDYNNLYLDNPKDIFGTVTLLD